MASLAAYLEIDEDGVEQGARIWMSQLPGFFARGKTEAEALGRLEPSIGQYIEWMGKIASKILGEAAAPVYTNK